MTSPRRSRNQGRGLAELLWRQPARIKAASRFGELVKALNASTRLRAVRLGKRPWSLLNEPRLRPYFLDDFRRTYRLPEDPFFRIFLELKWEDKAERAARKDKRAADIAAIMDRSFPPALAFIRWLGELEASHASKRALWRSLFEPRTKKRARELAALDALGWKALLQDYLTQLCRLHPPLTDLVPEHWFAYMLLETLPDPATGKPPKAGELRSAWRRAVKSHHPDSGGDAEYFRLLDEARRSLGL